MDSDTAKNLISRIRQSDLDEEEQEEAIRQVKAERARGKPAAYVQISGPEDDEMGGTAKLRFGERTTVEVRPPEEWVEDMDMDPDEDYVSMAVDLELTRLDGELPSDEGRGSASAYDEDLIGADYHLTYGQGKALLRLLGVDRIGTPGDVESTLRHELGPPEDVNPLLRDIQENGVRGWRTL